MQVQIAVSWNDDIIGLLARKIGIQWSHAAIRYRYDDEWQVIEALWRGIVKRSWIEFVEKKEKIKLFETIEPLTIIEENRIIAFASGNVGKPYDFGLMLKIAWECLKKYFGLGIVTYSSHVCSTLVHASFKYAGIDLCPGDEIVTPDDLANSKLVKEC